MKGYKANLRKFKKIEIVPTIFFLCDHNDMKLETNKRKVRRSTNMCKQHTSKQPIVQRKSKTGNILNLVGYSKIGLEESL